MLHATHRPDDTERQAQEDRELQIVANFRDKNEKLAWMRKKAKIEKMVTEQISPIETKILELMAQKEALIDEIAGITKDMTKECIHPHDYLIHYGVYIKCKFCEAKISIPKKTK